MIRLTRRSLLATAAAGIAAPAAGLLPANARAQGASTDLGVLTPLTGAGSFDDRAC